jgi:serine/threonine-protein kinase HipA
VKRNEPAPAPLAVFAGGRRAGVLRRSDADEDAFLFTYRDDAPETDAVSLTMPVRAAPYDQMSTVHPIFEMNLPEGALRERLRLLFAKTVPDFDELALLSIVGQSQIGRLRYAPPDSALPEVPEEDIPRLLAHAGADELFDDLLRKYASHSGVSGIQPKVLLRGKPRAAGLDRVTERGATHIVKSFDPREYPDLCANELFCLTAARLAGLPVVKAKLSANRSILAVERFDRAAHGRYLGVEDFCVLSALRAYEKYEGSYELVARRIEQYVSPIEQRAAKEQLFAMVALFAAVENGDGHLKNFAVTYDEPEGVVSLAPIYDVVCTTLYNPRDVFALTLDDSKELPDRRRILAFGRRACGLSARDCVDILGRVVGGVTKTIPRIRALATKQPGFERAAKRLVAVFERGARRLAP